MNQIALKSMLIAICWVLQFCTVSATSFMQISFINTHESQGYGSVGHSMVYAYRQDIPDLLDSVRINVTQSDETGQTGNYFLTDYFDGSVTINNGNRTYDYYKITGTNQSTRTHLTYILDYLGRVIRYTNQHWNNTSGTYYTYRESFRHYNAAGYVDSLYHTVGVANYTYFTREFIDGMLYRTTTFNSSHNPLYRYTYSYNSPPEAYPATVRFDNLNIPCVEGSTFEMVFNPQCMPNTITEEHFSDDQWSLTNKPIVADFDSYNNRYRFTYGATGGNNSYIKAYANALGDVTYVRYTYDDDWYDSVSISWRPIVSNEDNYIPPPNNLSIYPNPFRDNLNISFDKNDATTSDIFIYNLKGQLIRQWKGSKATELVWDGKDAKGNNVAQGIYLIKLQTGRNTVTTKVLRY